MAAAKPKTRTTATTKQQPRVSTHPPKVRTKATLVLIAKLRRICLALPDVTEVVAWAEPTWRVGAAGKMFAMCDTYHHGSPHLAVHLAAPAGAQEALIDSDGARFFRPPYTGAKGWVGVVLDTEPDWDMVASLVATARDLIAPAPKAARTSASTAKQPRPPPTPSRASPSTARTRSRR